VRKKFPLNGNIFRSTEIFSAQRKYFPLNGNIFRSMKKIDFLTHAHFMKKILIRFFISDKNFSALFLFSRLPKNCWQKINTNNGTMQKK